MRGIIIQDDLSIDEKRLRENVREVEHTRRAVEEVVDLRGVRIVEYERNEGWLTATIQSPSFLEPLMLFVELHPDYPAKEPPRFFFPKNPGNRALENLTQAAHDVAVVYQKNKRGGGRCLEDCLAFIAKALMSTSFAQSQHYPPTTYGTLSSSSSMVFNPAGLDHSSGSFITPPGGSVMLGSTAFFPSESLSDLSETFTANTREDPNTNSFSNQPSPNKGMSPTIVRIHPSLAMDDISIEPISLEPQSASPSTMENPSTPSPAPGTRSLHHHPSSASSNMAVLSKRRSRCSASFAGGDAIVLFTSSFVPITSSAIDGIKIQTTWTWGSDNEDEDLGKMDKKRTGGAKEVSHLSILPALVHPVDYDFYSSDNAQIAPSTIAKMAWNVLERCPDNALSRETMHVLIQKLKQSNDAATLAMLAARAAILKKVELLSMTPIDIEHYKRVYGEQLQRQGRFNARCQLDKISPSKQESMLLTDCQWTYTPKAKCGLCRLTVKGSLVWCNKCDHGGHSHCMANWFRQEDTCPTGCGCRCITSNSTL